APMDPPWQPRSIPLAEGICCTISDMNAGHLRVTQQTLTEQLVKNYPGMAVPSHNVLYHILGTLIKERKIYHTGEGYFTVTPNTYCTPKDAREDNRGVLLGDSCCCSSPSTTHLANIKHCADPVKENVPTVSCYRSCHCFSDQNMLSEQRHRQLMSHEPQGQGKKDCSELRPSIQTRGISTSAENHSWDTVRSLTSLKAKLKSKRFGLGLFWRSVSKPEKHQMEYSTFSAQFPPREWPVRDEDDLDNIPRDIEHEIIKRINPILTVDNLIKHTILMQRPEQQEKYISNEVSVVRQKHLSQGCIQKAQSQTVNHTKKPKPKKEKQKSRGSRKCPTREVTPVNVTVEEKLRVSVRHQEPPAAAVESQVIYKRQITNPFQGLPWRCSSYWRGGQGVADSQLKRRAWRPQPWAPLGPSATAKQHNPLQAHSSCLQPQTQSLGQNCPHLQGTHFQIDHKSQCLLESNVSEENICRRTAKKKSRDIKKTPCTYTEDSGVCKEEAKLPSYLKEEHCRCKADTVCELLDRTANEFQNVHLSNYTASANLVKNNGVQYRQKTDERSELTSTHDCAGSVKLEGEGFTDNCHLLEQEGQEGDTDSEPCPPLPPGRALSEGDRSTALSLKPCEGTACPAQERTAGNTSAPGEQGYKGDGSKEHPKRTLRKEGRLCSQALPRGPREDAGTVADLHLAGSDADTSRDLTPEVGEGAGVERCALGSQGKDVRNPLGNKELLVGNTCPVISGQRHSEGTETHSTTGDSGIDSPR
ncbi:STOX1 protein, partial [Pitta sordida]|nr:STOX1 protein [Pitta sordida]